MTPCDIARHPLRGQVRLANPNSRTEVVGPCSLSEVGKKTQGGEKRLRPQATNAVRLLRNDPAIIITNELVNLVNLSLTVNGGSPCRRSMISAAPRQGVQISDARSAAGSGGRLLDQIRNMCNRGSLHEHEEIHVHRKILSFAV